MTYPFRFPKDTPALTYEGLRNTVRIGTTVTAEHSEDYVSPFVTLSLYGTPLARISAAHVQFLRTGDHHQATREWLTRIVQDNGIGSACFRIRGGLMVIDGDPGRPVEGVTYRRLPRMAR
jgi:hypothetical protein